MNIAGSQIDLAGEIVARPRTDLIAYRIPTGAHVRSLIWGLAPDRWIGTELRFRAWPGAKAADGRYELTLALPKDKLPRKVELTLAGKSIRKFSFVPGQVMHLTIPASGSPTEALGLYIDVPETPLDGRVLGLKVRDLRYVTGTAGSTRYTEAAEPTRDASRRASALSVRSHVKSRSSRPK